MNTILVENQLKTSLDDHQLDKFKFFIEEKAVPISIVQHISEGFGEGLVQWLDKECDIMIKTGNDGENYSTWIKSDQRSRWL